MSPRRARAVTDQTGDPAEALREHLIDAATGLLAERTVPIITTRDIARAAGVSDGVLYNYFADKNDLILTVLVRRFAGLLARFEARLPEPGAATVEDNLTECSAALLELACDALSMVSVLLSEPPLAQRFLQAVHEQPSGPETIFRRISQYLEGEQALGRISAADLDAATDLIFGATAALALTSVLGGIPREAVAARLPAVARTLIGGLAP
jgi:AcrR family transcriptional regulator